MKSLTVLLMCCALMSACAGSSQRQSPTPAQITVNVEPGFGGGKPVAPYFTGFSIEASALCSFLHFEQSHPAIDHLYRNLGPTIIRVGGNSMDFSVWRPDATCSDVTFGRSTIADLFAFARRADASIIWGLNVKANDPITASDEASAVVALGGSRLIGFEIGNEPNNWANESAYEYTWETYVSAMNAQNISPALVGPSMYDYGGSSWFRSFVQKERATLSVVTYHYYPLNRGSSSASADSPSIAHLLSPELMARTAQDIDRVAAIAHTNGLPLEIDETNSANGGGVAGVSDVFASALWMADYLFTAEEHGTSAVNVHGAGGAAPYPLYSPIRTPQGSSDPVASPVYYGMYLFHLATGDGATSPLPATISSSANIAAHAIRGRNGEIRIALINKDAHATVDAQVKLERGSANYRVTHVLRMQAPSLVATSGATLGGAAIRSDGTWSATTSSEDVHSSGSSFTVSVPQGSAVLVTLTPGA